MHLERFIIENNQININEKELSDLIKKYGEKTINDELVKLIISGKVTFPYKKYFMDDVNIMYKRLCEYKPKIRYSSYIIPNIKFNWNFDNTFQGKYMTFVSPNKDYDTMDIIVDYFQEHARLSALRSDTTKTPLQCWTIKECVTIIVSYAMSLKSISSYTLRESIYHAKITEATQFKPTLVVSIIKTLYADPSSINYLDISSGWGDRLVGAMAAGVKKYLGFDPNTTLKVGHDKIRERFISLTNGDISNPTSRFEIRYEPFESTDLGNSTFDLVFSSPPFWDFEKYTDLPGQSIITHNTYVKWIVGFLFTSLARACQHLNNRGFIIIHITDVYRTKVVEPMILFIQGYLKNIHFQGVISSLAEESSNKHRPMWVWKKNTTLEIKDAKAARINLAKFYPAIHSGMKGIYYM
jgi:hypothetical protein